MLTLPIRAYRAPDGGGPTFRFARQDLGRASSWRGSWEATLATDGLTLTGSISFSDRPDIGVAELSGQISGSSIEFGIVAATKEVVTFSRSISEQALNGTFSATSGDHGVWEGFWTGDPPAIDIAKWPPPDAVTAIVETDPVELGISPRTSIEPPKAQPVGIPGIEAWWRKLWAVARAYAQTVGANVLVNLDSDSGTQQAEPEVAVNWPINPSCVVTGVNDRFFDVNHPHAVAYASADGGQNWLHFGQVPGLENFDNGGDSVLDFNGNGRLFYAGIAYDDSSPCSTDNAVFVASSDDCLQTWTGNATQVVFSSAASGVFNDRPWFAADKRQGNPNVYVSWTRFSGTPASCNSQAISVSRSANYGAPGSFSSPTDVSDTAFVQCSTMAVDPNGTANIAWRHILSNKTARIEFDQCTPGPGGTVNCGTPDKLVATINSITLSGLNGLSTRPSSDPVMAINVRGPGTQQYGYIYLVWAAKRVPDPLPPEPPTDTDIYFTLSNDGGATFLTPYAIPSATTSTDEFFPTIAVDSANFVNVIFYRRTSQTANAFNAYIITTGNAGQVWSSPIKLNDGGNITALQNFIGDYIGLDANSHSTIHSVWLDTRRGQNDIYSTIVSGC